ncbi:MAG: CoA-binding protein [Fimbriimonadaceae bacterium]|jgi:hypothetical protein|nr:CoA-binding protein [Fimbriimonadaceae bacterium]
MGLGPSSASTIELNTAFTAEERDRYQNTKVIQALLSSAKTIAVVGISSESTKASNMVASYLRDEGYRVIPINPRASEILGEPCFPNLAAVSEKVDIVNVFRPSSELAEIFQQAEQIGAKAVWSQLRLFDTEAADRALTAGLEVVMDKCIKMEHGRYCGALHWAGMNTEIITARRR